MEYNLRFEKRGPRTPKAVWSCREIEGRLTKGINRGEMGRIRRRGRDGIWEFVSRRVLMSGSMRGCQETNNRKIIGHEWKDV